MAQIVDIQPLRVNGVRTVDLPYAVSGQFRVRNLDGHTELTLVGHKTGRILLGPLRNPKLVAAEPDGFVIFGLELSAEGETAQEWMVVLAQPNPAPPEVPLW